MAPNQTDMGAGVMMKRLAVLTLGTALLAACQTGAVDETANPDEPPPPPATPPAPSPTVQPLAPAVSVAPAPELGPGAPDGSNPTLATLVDPFAYAGTFRGSAPDGQSIQVEILDINATGARVNHQLGPGGPLLPGQGVWRNGTLTMVVAEGSFSYTPDGPDALRYLGPGPSGGTVTVVLSRV